MESVVLVTGAAGFIGLHMCLRFFANNIHCDFKDFLREDDL